jgi:hypothetical protein
MEIDQILQHIPDVIKMPEWARIAFGFSIAAAVVSIQIWRTKVRNAETRMQMRLWLSIRHLIADQRKKSSKDQEVLELYLSGTGFVTMETAERIMKIGIFGIVGHVSLIDRQIKEMPADQKQAFLKAYLLDLYMEWQIYLSGFEISGKNLGAFAAHCKGYFEQSLMDQILYHGDRQAPSIWIENQLKWEWNRWK